MATFTPQRDAYMDYLSADTNFGSFTFLSASVIYTGGVKSTLLRAIFNFDISSIAGQTLLTAKLVLNANYVWAQAAATLYRCTRPATWTEAGVTYNKYDGTNAWTAAGGDMDGTTPTPVGLTTPAGTGNFEITGLLAFATDAVANRSNIASFIMKMNDEGPSVSVGFRFDSKEGSTAPQFVVTYQGEGAAVARSQFCMI